MRHWCFFMATCAIVGCGPSETDRREITLSILNTEADRWDGGKEFVTSAVDGYGKPISASMTKGMLNHVLKIRSNGKDGLPKNTDDITVERSKRHGESVVSDQAVRDVGEVSGGMVKGAVEGFKEGLGFRRNKKE